MQIFKYCEAAFNSIGINVAFPQKTDPQKTYKWRYLCKFVRSIDEAEVPEAMVPDLINIVAAYAAETKQIHKGLSLLASDQVLIVCCERLLRKDRMHDDVVEMIGKSRDKVVATDPGGKAHAKSLTNVVKWFVHGELSETYLALSKRCHEAMVKLDKVERSMLPNGMQLIAVRDKLFKDVRLKHRIKLAMKDDWREIFG